jgi:hypothetical protein
LDDGYGAVDKGPLENGVRMLPLLIPVPEIGSVPDENPVPLPATIVEFDVGKGGSVGVGCEVGVSLKPDEFVCG